MIFNRARRFLPQVYVPFDDILPKHNQPTGGSIEVSMERIIRISGLSIELKKMINNSEWKSALLKMCVGKFGWCVIEDIFWEKFP